MKKIVKWIIAVFLYYSGIFYIYRRGIKPLFIKNKLIILRYHRIFDVEQNDPINISVRCESFAQQMAYVRRYFDVLPIEDIVDCIEKNQHFSHATLGITFDDGYKNNYVLAFPILRRLKLPATIFITVNYMDDHRVFVWDQGNWANDSSATKMLSWKEIEDMKKGGISFGSHTLTHQKLGKIELPDARREIFDSKKILEQRLSAKIDILSYPHGDYSVRVKELVKEAGYVAAFSSDDGRNAAGTDIFALKRKAIHESLTANPFGKFSKAIFALEIEGIFDWLFRRKNSINVS